MSYADEQARKDWEAYRKAHPESPVEGVTLRDWFAGQALAGVLQEGRPANVVKNIADDAYLIADAMLAKRLADGA